MSGALHSTHHVGMFADQLEDWLLSPLNDMNDPAPCHLSIGDQAVQSRVYDELRRVIREVRFMEKVMVHADKYADGDHGSEEFLAHVARVREEFRKQEDAILVANKRSYELLQQHTAESGD